MLGNVMYVLLCFPFQFVPIMFVISTRSMLLMDQRTMQIKYRIPAAEIFKLSLSPFFDDIAVFHVKAVSNTNTSKKKGYLTQKTKIPQIPAGLGCNSFNRDLTFQMSLYCLRLLGRA